jgi:hypothetical protein
MKTEPNEPINPIMKDNMPAYRYDNHLIGTDRLIGITKRECFAAMAMQGLCAKMSILTDPEEYAIASCAIADALIKELNK